MIGRRPAGYASAPRAASHARSARRHRNQEQRARVSYGAAPTVRAGGGSAIPSRVRRSPANQGPPVRSRFSRAGCPAPHGRGLVAFPPTFVRVFPADFRDTSGRL